MPQTRQNIRHSAMWPAAMAISLTVVALPHPAHGKLPPPTPAEQAAAAKQAETERAQKAQEQAQLTEVQDRLAARFGKGGNNAAATLIAMPTTVAARPIQSSAESLACGRR